MSDQESSRTRATELAHRIRPDASVNYSAGEMIAILDEYTEEEWAEASLIGARTWGRVR